MLHEFLTRLEDSLKNDPFHTTRFNISLIENKGLASLWLTNFTELHGKFRFLYHSISLIEYLEEHETDSIKKSSTIHFLCKEARKI